ncbi:tRNA 2-thiocytidine biosynthesis protein [Spironucleus salmonicida]|uniref:tRNA 2-thiocytidine biosynthesis protein n=1 Tax=Spironucleus salmonicida TaxID=348837 RepID=V6M124_9EUKA|nr:tRNA 2-thiocytidine biosynthesis protein [Spironucleus salmonicida]|eukprot:EST46869.1 hypothetical protein SS50377_13021 [Spironucleus salmonicida]
MKIKPQKRLLIHIQNQFYQYFSNQQIQNLYFIINGEHTNSALMIFLLQNFNAKQQKQFTLTVSGDQITQEASLIVENYHLALTPNIPPENALYVSLLSKNALITSFLDQIFEKSHFYLFSQISDIELQEQAEQADFSFTAMPFTPFMEKSVHVNYSVISNLQKSLIAFQLSKPVKIEPFYRFPEPLGGVPPALLNSACRILSTAQPQKKTILVAFSGGKDSAATYLTLQALQPRFDFALKAQLFDPQLPGFSTERVQKVADYFGIPLEIVTKKVVPQDFSLCASCARARRIALLESRPAFLALGHHLKDSVETILMTGMHNGAFFPLRGLYTPEIDGVDGETRVIRPLLDCTQGDVLAFTGAFAVEFVSSDAAECDFAARGGGKESERGRIRRFLDGRDYGWFAEMGYE